MLFRGIISAWVGMEGILEVSLSQIPFCSVHIWEKIRVKRCFAYYIILSLYRIKPCLP